MFGLLGGKPAWRRRPYFCLLQSAIEYSRQSPDPDSRDGAGPLRAPGRDVGGGAPRGFHSARSAHASSRSSREVGGVCFGGMFSSAGICPGRPRRDPSLCGFPCPLPTLPVHTCKPSLCGLVQPPASNHPQPKRGATRGEGKTVAQAPRSCSAPDPKSSMRTAFLPGESHFFLRAGVVAKGSEESV